MRAPREARKEPPEVELIEVLEEEGEIDDEVSIASSDTDSLVGGRHRANRLSRGDLREVVATDEVEEVEEVEGAETSMPASGTEADRGT